jgi:hypothetical protein
MWKLPVCFGKEEGIYFVETLFALFILSVGIISISGLFLLSIKQNAMAEDMTQTSVLAQDKMEELMNIDFESLVASGDAGSISTDETDYFDAPLPNYTRRWQIDVDAPVAGMATIRVDVFSSRELIGLSKACTLKLARSR